MLALHLNLHEQHAANKSQSYHLNRVYVFLCFTLSYWCGIMEWGLFYGDLEHAIRAVFNSFDPQIQHDLTFTQKAAGDWIARANLWRSALKPALPAEWYYPTMSKIYAHYRKCIMRRKAADRT